MGPMSMYGSLARGPTRRGPWSRLPSSQLLQYLHFYAFRNFLRNLPRPLKTVPYARRACVRPAAAAALRSPALRGVGARRGGVHKCPLMCPPRAPLLTYLERAAYSKSGPPICPVSPHTFPVNPPAGGAVLQHATATCRSHSDPAVGHAHACITVLNSSKEMVSSRLISATLKMEKSIICCSPMLTPGTCFFKIIFISCFVSRASPSSSSF
jgi:hypothetical protein